MSDLPLLIFSAIGWTFYLVTLWQLRQQQRLTKRAIEIGDEAIQALTKANNTNFGLVEQIHELQALVRR